MHRARYFPFGTERERSPKMKIEKVEPRTMENPAPLHCDRPPSLRNNATITNRSVRFLRDTRLFSARERSDTWSRLSGSFTREKRSALHYSHNWNSECARAPPPTLGGTRLREERIPWPREQEKRYEKGNQVGRRRCTGIATRTNGVVHGG